MIFVKEIQVMDQQVYKTPHDVLREYMSLEKEKPNTANKRRKEIERAMASIKDMYRSLDQDAAIMKTYLEKQEDLEYMYQEKKDTASYLENNVQLLIHFLQKEGFVAQAEQTKYTLTPKGSIASHIREVHCLAFGSFIEETPALLNVKQWVGIFSCFTNISVPEDKRGLLPSTKDAGVQETIMLLREKYDYYLNYEEKNNITTGQNYEIQYDLLPYAMEWTTCENSMECKLLLQKMEQEKEIFLGEFVKALLKINNIASEIENIAEQKGDMQLLLQMRAIPGAILKYVATNQSLYV
jgi:hypothetical protein